jgi:hypothetical protein
MKPYRKGDLVYPICTYLIKNHGPKNVADIDHEDKKRFDKK